MWYSRLVPDRLHPMTKTGDLLRAVFIEADRIPSLAETGSTAFLVSFLPPRFCDRRRRLNQCILSCHLTADTQRYDDRKLLPGKSTTAVGMLKELPKQSIFARFVAGR